VSRETLIAKSRRLFLARWWTVAVATVGVLVMLSVAPDNRFDVIALPLAIMIGTAGAVISGLVALSSQLNKELANSLSLGEIRSLIRSYGRAAPLQAWQGQSDLLGHCLPRLGSRSELSAEEWNILARATTHGFAKLSSESTQLLLRAKVFEVVSDLAGIASSPLGGSRRIRRLVSALGRISASQRAELPAFAPALHDPRTASDFIGEAKRGRHLTHFLVMLVVLTLGCKALSALSGSSGFFPPMFLATLGFVRYLSVKEKFSGSIAPALEASVLPTLLRQWRDSENRQQKRLIGDAIIGALGENPDFSTMQPQDHEVLWNLYRSGSGRMRKSLTSTLRDHISPLVLSLVQEEATLWMQSSHRGAPRRIRELTELRMSIIGRRERLEKTAVPQEVP